MEGRKAALLYPRLWLLKDHSPPLGAQLKALGQPVRCRCRKQKVRKYQIRDSKVHLLFSNSLLFSVIFQLGLGKKEFGLEYTSHTVEQVLQRITSTVCFIFQYFSSSHKAVSLQKHDWPVAIIDYALSFICIRPDKQQEWCCQLRVG